MADCKTESLPITEIGPQAPVAEDPEQPSPVKVQEVPVKSKAGPSPKSKLEQKIPFPASSNSGAKNSPKKNPWSKPSSPGEESKKAPSSATEGGPSAAAKETTSPSKSIKIPKDQVRLVRGIGVLMKLWLIRPRCRPLEGL